VERGTGVRDDEDMARMARGCGWATKKTKFKTQVPVLCPVYLYMPRVAGRSRSEQPDIRTRGSRLAALLFEWRWCGKRPRGDRKNKTGNRRTSAPARKKSAYTHVPSFFNFFSSAFLSVSRALPFTSGRSRCDGSPRSD
jgi:hypothetical protein